MDFFSNLNALFIFNNGNAFFVSTSSISLQKIRSRGGYILSLRWDRSLQNKWLFDWFRLCKLPLLYFQTLLRIIIFSRPLRVPFFHRSRNSRIHYTINCWELWQVKSSFDFNSFRKHFYYCCRICITYISIHGMFIYSRNRA